MHVEILSPEKAIFIGESLILTLPGNSGSFSILKDHAPLMSLLGTGTIVIEATINSGKGSIKDLGRLNIPINRGVVEVMYEKVVVLVQE
jgi:F-type H+-transporting ATPase subunit epsilon